MAKQTQRPAPKSKPITSNPLFPAVVALWFGALFGLSSVAVRVSVIESLVMKTGIDLIVPAAAPPLGITARILVALIMAALGAMIGAMIGRRLARPKMEVRERKRSAKTNEAEQPRVRARDSHPDAPARKPISAHEEFGGDPVREEAPAAPGALANRRRSLTAETEPQVFVPQEVAPLPGGEPQILDLAGAEIDRPVAVEVPPAPQAMDLNAFDGALSTTAPDAEPIWTPVDEPVVAPVQDLSDDGESADRQVFHAAEAIAEPVDASPVLAGRQVFGMAPVEPQHPDERQIFTAPSEIAPVTEAVEAAGFQTSVFDAPPAPPLFGDRAAEAPAAAVSEVAVAVTPEVETLLPSSPREPLPDLSGLGMTDLAERLKDSMARRRAARAQSPQPGLAAPAPAPVTTPLPRFSAEPLGEAVVQVEAAPVASAPLPAPASPPPPAELPAALRPLSLDAFADDDEDDDALASLLPPRHIAMPPAFAPVAAPAFAAPAADSEPEDDSADEPEGDYASLLKVAPPVAGRPTFVRIEEPRDDAEAIEPVVIFPGQGPRVPLGTVPAGAALDVAPVVSPEQDEPASFRRFDAPASAGQGQPIAANPVAPVIDPEEAERSLRSALANLQRISGAA